MNLNKIINTPKVNVFTPKGVINKSFTGGVLYFNSMKEIKLTQGFFALVDDEDFEQMNQYSWFISKSFNTYYDRR